MPAFWHAFLPIGRLSVRTWGRFPRPHFFWMGPAAGLGCAIAVLACLGDRLCEAIILRSSPFFLRRAAPKSRPQ